MIDVTHQIDSVQRKVGSRVLEAGEARVVTLSRTYDATIHDVWDACTNAERIPRWFLPVTGDLRAGGHYQLTGNASGTVERCDPPEGFTATWEFGGSLSWIELRLTAETDSMTRFELDHIVPVDEHFAEFGPARSESAGTWRCPAWRSTWPPGSRWTRQRQRRGWLRTRAGGLYRSAATAGARRVSPRERMRPPRRPPQPGRWAPTRGQADKASRPEPVSALGPAVPDHDQASGPGHG